METITFMISTLILTVNKEKLSNLALFLRKFSEISGKKSNFI